MRSFFETPAPALPRLLVFPGLVGGGRGGSALSNYREYFINDPSQSVLVSLSLEEKKETNGLRVINVGNRFSTREWYREQAVACFACRLLVSCGGFSGKHYPWSSWRLYTPTPL